MAGIITDLKNRANLLINPKTRVDFNVFVSIVAHRDVKVKTLDRIRALEKCPNPHVKVHTLDGDALISRARSRVASTFLRDMPDYEYLFFFDDDIVFDTLDITRMMWMAKKGDLDILSAAYPIKQMKDSTMAIRTLENDIEVCFGKEGGGQLEVRYGSTGCICIHRRVFEKMIETHTVELCHPDTVKFYDFFADERYCIAHSSFKPCIHSEGHKWIFLSEDWYFCEKARELGFKVWCDTETKLGHIGPYEFTWDDFLRPPKESRDSFVYKVKVDRE